MALAQNEIVRDLRALGLQPGALVMTHSSLSALGEVEGGAQTVIEALLEVLGPKGTLVMPAMSSGVYDHENSPSNVGAITEAFRQWPGVVRSFHPSHSVCALGPLAEWLTADHLASPTALGPETPFGRLVAKQGQVLFLGVDQDRNTLLHAAEEAVRAPYLSTRQFRYLDADGHEQVKTLELYPGPHRDFIGLDHLFREAGVMRVGKVGRAVCRLMEAKGIFDLTVQALRQDPAAVLCDNPLCADCVKQRGKIKRHRLATEEDFTLAALLDEVAEGALGRAGDRSEALAPALLAVAGEGIQHVELGPELTHLAADQTERMAELFAQADLLVSMTTSVVGRGARFEAALSAAEALHCSLVKVKLPSTGMRPTVEALRSAADMAAERNITIVIENSPATAADTRDRCEDLISRLDDAPVELAFNPAHFAHAGEHPFRQTWYRWSLKERTRQLYITDGALTGGYTLPGRGNGEVKELMSILRCRGFDGFFTLRMGDRRGVAAFREHAARFWRLLDTI